MCAVGRHCLRLRVLRSPRMTLSFILRCTKGTRSCRCIPPIGTLLIFVECRGSIFRHVLGHICRQQVLRFRFINVSLYLEILTTT